RNAAHVRSVALSRVRLRRRAQPDAVGALDTGTHGCDRRRARLVRHRLPGHRPGTDPRHDRELPERARVEDDAQESAHPSWARARGIHRRLAEPSRGREVNSFRDEMDMPRGTSKRNRRLSRNALRRLSSAALLLLIAAGCAPQPGPQVTTIRFWAM